MAGNRGLCGGIEPREAPEQPEGDEGQDEAHGGTGGEHGQGGNHAALGAGQRRPAFEADGHHQVDRQIAADAFRNGKVGFQQAGGNAEGEEQDCRRQQVLQKQMRDFHGVEPPRGGFYLHCNNQENAIFLFYQ